MACIKQDACGNYPTLCKACEITSNAFVDYPFEAPPYFTQVAKPKVKFKIFYGNHTDVSADVKVNQWLAENPHIKLVDYQYQQVRMGDHSICVTYEEGERCR